MLEVEGGDRDRPGLVGSPRAITSKMLRYREAGVDELVIDFIERDHGGVPGLELMLDQLGLRHDRVLPELGEPGVREVRE